MFSIYQKIVLVYLIVINLVAYVTYGIDKKRSQHNRIRISEKTLLTFPLIGAFIGSYLAMKIFRHKTKHLSFKVLVPIFSMLSFVLSIIVVFDLLPRYFPGL